MAKPIQKQSGSKLAPKNSTQVQAIFQQAFTHHQKGELVQAQTLYEKLLKLQPNHFDALHFLGVIAYQNNQYQTAVELISKAIAVDPEQAAAYSNIGMTLQALNQMDDALANYNRAIALKPNYAEAYYNRGNVLKALDRLDEALASYKQAFAIVPFYFQAHLNYGNTLLQLERLDEAIASYDKTIALNPNYVQAYFNRADALVKLKQYKEAVAYYSKVLALKPDHAEAYRKRGAMLAKLKRLDDALADYDKALSLEPDVFEMHFARGTALFTMQRYDEAQISYEQALALQPENQDAQYALAAMTQENIPGISPRAYVANLFDSSAETFDQHLVGDLDYQMPTILAAQFSRYVHAGQYDILDLGCGTGLSGMAFQNYAQRLVGIDLSARMLEKAGQRALYDELICTDIIEFLRTDQAAARDVIVCADVLVYIGDLDDLFAGIKHALKPGGWFSFSVEDVEGGGDGYELKLSQRYGHSLRYIQSLAESSGFIIKEALSTKLRKERGEYLSGHAFLLYKP